MGIDYDDDSNDDEREQDIAIRRAEDALDDIAEENLKLRRALEQIWSEAREPNLMSSRRGNPKKLEAIAKIAHEALMRGDKHD